MRSLGGFGQFTTGHSNTTGAHKDCGGSQEDLSEEYVSDYFDVFFPAVGASYGGGYLGFDEYQGDYFGLQPYEYLWAEDEAAKKIMSLTKKQILEAVGQ